MATDTRAGKGPAPAKYDAFVAAQLGRAEGRIRTLDLAAALLGFVAATLVFAVLMAAIDSRWNLSAGARQTALWLYLIGAAGYLFFLVLLPLRRRINPYYAARKVEATVPGAKNSVINWVDLHDQKLPPAIHSAVGQRAARDLGRADIDRAISGRRAGWAGGVAGAAVVGFLTAFFLLGPGPFFSILGRTFAPFREGGIPTRTQLSMVQPPGGDATVTVDRPVTLVVHVDGRLPDPQGPEAVRLLYRYEEDDSQERLLQRAEGSERDWEITLPAADVRNGFWYRVTAGDGSTPLHRITVRAAPALTEFLATYHFRPYVARIDELSHERDLKALRGTEVLLRVRTNRAVKDARFEWEGKDGPQSIPAQTDPADPQSFQVRRVIDEDGRYRLAFTSAEGETYTDPAPHTVTAVPDLPPRVELTKPGQDVSLPANGLLHLEGKATDDVGVQGIVLRAQVPGGARLQPRPYRSQERLRLADGGYPLSIEYKDSLDLGAVKGEDGKAVVLKAGMEVEYWLEASDACDYDRPHVGQSQRFKVKITEPDKDAARRQQDRRKAEEEQKKHEQQQDRQLKQENKQREEERKQQEARNKEEQQKDNEARQGQGGEPKGQKPRDDPNAKKPEDGAAQKGDEGKQDDPLLNKDNQEKADRLQSAIDKQKQQQGQDKGGEKGEDKPDKPQGPGESKPDNQGEGKKGGEQGNAGQKSEGEGKDAGKQGAAGAGEDKKQGQQGGNSKAGETKSGGQSDPMKGGMGEPKPDEGKGQAGQEAKGEEKGKGKQGGGEPRRAEGKPAGSPEQSQTAGQDKPAGQPAPDGAQTKAEPKDTGAEGGKPENRQALGEKKENAGQGGKCEKCEGKGAGNGSRDGQGTAKAGGGPGENGKNGEGKPNAGGGQDATQADVKPGSGGGGGRRAEDATPQDVERLAKDLQSADGQTAEDAARKLEQIKEQAKNPQARDAANEALDEMKKNQGTGDAGEPKEPPKPMGDPTQPGAKGGNAGSEAKGGKAGGEPGAGDAKSGGGGNMTGDKANGKGRGEKREGDPKNPDAPGSAKGPRGRPPGNDPGNGQEGARTDTERPVGGKGGLEGKASRPEAHRPGALQLDDFKKRIDRKVLDDARMTEEEYRKFLRDYEEALRRRKEAPRAEALPPAQQPGGPLPSFAGGGGKSGDGRPGDVGSDTRALPPAPYRDAYNKFTRELSRPADKK
jgi:hypothetical protein